MRGLFKMLTGKTEYGRKERATERGLQLHSLLQRSPKKGILNPADAPSAHNTNLQWQSNYLSSSSEMCFKKKKKKMPKHNDIIHKTLNWKLDILLLYFSQMETWAGFPPQIVWVRSGVLPDQLPQRHSNIPACYSLSDQSAQRNVPI